MSAIWALLHHDGQPADPAELAAMSAALAQLGPERSGAWQAGPVGLGHRLMSFTPEDLREQQPIRSGDGRLRLVFDGRLDNRPELAQALGLTAEQAREWPDSAFVLRALEEWGEDCPQRLVGGLAFIAWDAPRQRLFAASTPGNSCVLFYHQTPRRLALASMPRGLLALPGVPRKLNETRLAEYLLYSRAYARSSTFFEDIQRLPSGYSLSAEGGAVQVRRYWAPDLAREIRYPRDEDYVAAFNELFERVVADQLRSLTPVGVMLSSGLDSMAVAVTAADQLQARGEKLVSFTSVPDARSTQPVPPGRYGDERAYVLAMAREHANLEAVVVDTDGQWVLDGLEARFEHQEAPPGPAANTVWLDAILRRASERGLRVLLSGLAGNLVVSWTGQGLIAHYLRRGRAGAAWREARALARTGQSRSPWRALLGQGLLPLLPDRVWAAVERLRGRDGEQAGSSIRPSFAAAHGLAPEPAGLNPAERLSADGRRARYGYATGRTAQSMPGWRSQFGVDVRDPTGDQRLVEFCLALPHDQFQRNGQSRWLIRRAMAGRLPPEVLWNPERGLQSSDWLYRLQGRREAAAAALRAVEQDELALRALAVERLRKLVEAWPDPAASGPETKEEYRLLQDGLVAGRFILWARSGGGSGGA